ncbi:class III lanthionine synthetase LanKC N-terminal domain-containing protein [Kitasatospora mediocidica]|uniref:class III lanthionine synthetase LanKC N-terminal domain-containing protein n=1 Tax=Kitasatospora mediocidica TaxID=58352 RepID=UPI00056B1514|nr:hypothetical protein [Kitasatospora mediocidica]
MPDDRLDEWRELLGPARSAVLSADMRERLSGSGWTLRDDGFWCHARPPGAVLPEQGWKLHVSTVPTHAARTLAACLPVLRRARVTFKFAADQAVLHQVVSARYEESGVGKFLTAYPADPRQCALLAEKLAEATAGMPGPGVSSDARWAPDSPVYYRYGAVRSEHRLDDRGGLVSVLTAPDGRRVPDPRHGYAPPAWAPELPRPVVPTRPGASSGRATRDGLLLAGRFRVTGVLQRSSRGGVFTALDQQTGAVVVVKHVRPHIGATAFGTDARDVLRHEAQALRALGPTGAVPALVDLVELGEALLLVQERLPGVSLADWVRTRWRPGRGCGPLAFPVARSLGKAVDAVHELGWTLRDLSPGNVVVDELGRARLVDLELAARPDDSVYREYTRGYAAPEQVHAPLRGPAPGPSADLHALGGLLFLLASGRDPHALSGLTPAAELLGAQLARVPDESGFAAAAAGPVARLMTGDPALRPQKAPVLRPASPRRASPQPSSPQPSSPQPIEAPSHPARAIAGLSVLLHDGLADLVMAVLDGGPQALRLTAPHRRRRDPRGLQHGIAGPLLLLARALRHADRSGRADPADLRAAVALLARDVERHDAVGLLGSGPDLGLRTGEAGVLWALWEAAEALDDDDMRRRCLARAVLPPREATHPEPAPRALAGLGLLQLRLYLATGSAVMARAARDCASTLAATPTVPTADSTATTLFLLEAGAALDHRPARRAARAAVAAMAQELGTARVDGVPDLAYDTGLTGRGQVLARAAHRGLPGTADALARLCSLPQGWCTAAPLGLAGGVAGWAEFLLDAREPAAADPTGAAGLFDRWTAVAPLVGEFAARANVRDGRLLLPDDSGQDVGHALGDGVCGPLWLLLRLVEGGPGLWDPRPWPPAAAPGRAVRTPQDKSCFRQEERTP